METRFKQEPELDDSGLIEMISAYEKSNMTVSEFCEYNHTELETDPTSGEAFVFFSKNCPQQNSRHKTTDLG